MQRELAGVAYVKADYDHRVHAETARSRTAGKHNFQDTILGGPAPECSRRVVRKTVNTRETLIFVC